ncbi:MAG: 50S ribosomal protein L23 [Nanoarchaeota archaeon]|nr:50S ribosomal protein L23 [Nanoarchaeota archaeon]
MKPIATEKAVMMIERDNVLTFQAPMIYTKEQIKKELEDLLKIKITKIRTLIRNNKKMVYVKLKGDTLAIDVATKLGLM